MYCLMKQYYNTWEIDVIIMNKPKEENVYYVTK